MRLVIEDKGYIYNSIIAVKREMRTLTSDQWQLAKKLLQEAVEYQMTLEKSAFADQLIDQTTPVLWFGDATRSSWVTIATNPSRTQFLDRTGALRFDETGPLFIRPKSMSWEDYLQEETLTDSIRRFNRYFKQPNVYRTWFGRPGGGKLEGFLNGLGASFYEKTFDPVIHLDFFPFPTHHYMGAIKERSVLEDSPFGQTFLLRLLELFSIKGIILLGKEHTGRFAKLEPDIDWTTYRPTDYPNAIFQVGFSSRFQVPVVGLHFKPSEQFIGLGNRKDENGVSHGTYGSAEHLRQIGKIVREKVVKNSGKED